MLRLFQQFAHTATALDDLTAVLIQACTETGKGFQFLELCVGETQGPGDLSIGG